MSNARECGVAAGCKLDSPGDTSPSTQEAAFLEWASVVGGKGQGGKREESNGSYVTQAHVGI